MTWVYRAAVLALLAFCALKLYDIDRHSTSTDVLEKQMRELIKAVEASKPASPGKP